MMPGVTSAFQPRAAGHRNGTPTTPKWDTHRRTPKRRNGTPTEDHRTGTPTELGHPPRTDGEDKVVHKFTRCRSLHPRRKCDRKSSAPLRVSNKIGLPRRRGNSLGCRICELAPCTTQTNTHRPPCDQPAPSISERQHPSWQGDLHDGTPPQFREDRQPRLGVGQC